LGGFAAVPVMGLLLSVRASLKLPEHQSEANGA
jgi:hypothetical protein